MSKIQFLYHFLEIDYYKLNGLGGLNDAQWKNTKIFIEDDPWQRLRSIGGYFNLRIVHPNETYRDAPSMPIDYIRFRFVDDEEFNRLREEDRESRGLVRKEYVESNSLNSEDYNKNYVVYSRNYLEKIFPKTVPEDSEIATSLTTFEISGNYEPITFAIYAFEDLENIRISVTDLVGTKGKIDADNISIERVVNQDRRWKYAYDKYYGINPWYLDNFTSIDVRALTSMQIWLTVYVPQNTIEGTYTGTVSISGDNIEGTLGHIKYLFFYLACGVIAILVHLLVNSSSSYPIVGASGAISGILGAYLIRYPRARIQILIWLIISVSAWMV